MKSPLQNQLVLIGLGHYTVDFSQSAFASLGFLGNLSIFSIADLVACCQIKDFG